MCPLTSQTLKPTFGQSGGDIRHWHVTVGGMRLTNGGSGLRRE
jgi:hypothetical protein